MIKAILIDIDNTLLDFNECAKASMMQGFKDFNLTYKDEMFPTFIKINDFLWGEIEKGNITKEELLEVRWNKIFAKLGIEFDGVTFEDRFRYYIERSGHIVRDAHEVMDYLTSKYRVYAASNGFEKHQLGRLKEAKLIDKFSAIFVSEKAGYAKPSTEFFDYCFDRMGYVNKNEVIMIGDSVYADMKGGIDYGIKTCWFDFKRTQNCTAKVDYVIKNLTDLYKIL